MELKQERTIAAPPEKVWDALFDAHVLKACIPGCSEMTGSPDEGYEAVVTQKVGPVKATFKGHLEIVDREEPVKCRLQGEGKGGPAGFANGGANVTLTPTDDGGTVLSYEAEAQVGGKLAQLGGRVIDAFARRLADQFFTNFQAKVEEDGAPTRDAVSSATSEETPPPPPSDGTVGANQTDGSGAPQRPAARPAPTPAAQRDEVAAAKPPQDEKKGWFARLFGR